MIVTFGYGNRTSYGELLAAIEVHKVATLIDVRKNPRGWSPMWGASGLAQFCSENEVTYSSQKDLGNTSGKSDWIPPDPEKAEAALCEAVELLASGNILLLCAEKDYRRCHRTEVARRMAQQADVEVLHW